MQPGLESSLSVVVVLLLFNTYAHCKTSPASLGLFGLLLLAIFRPWSANLLLIAALPAVYPISGEASTQYTLCTQLRGTLLGPGGSHWRLHKYWEVKGNRVIERDRERA